MAQDFSLSWDIDTLNRAYRQGYMAGVMGANAEQCPFKGDIILAAWEAGWEDGVEQCALDKSNERISKIA